MAGDFTSYIAEKQRELLEQGEVFLRIKVTAKAPKTEVFDLLSDHTLKIRIQEPREQGKANKALAKYLGKLFNIPTSHVLILSGHMDPLKLIKLST